MKVSGYCQLLVTNIIHNIFFCLEQMEETPTEDE